MESRTKEDILNELCSKSVQSSRSFHRTVLTLSVSVLGLVVAFSGNTFGHIDSNFLKWAYVLAVSTLALCILFSAVCLHGYVVSDSFLAENFRKEVCDKNGAFYGKDEYAVQDSTPALYSVVSIAGYVLLCFSVLFFASYLVGFVF